MSQAKVLYDLQQIDDEIRAGKQRLGEVLRAQKETEAVAAARKQAAATAATLQKWQTRYTDLRLELGGVNDKAKHSEQRLYSGNVRNPKELTDLQHEIEALGRRRAAIEDEMLEAMIMVEESEVEETAAGEKLAAVETAWQSDQSTLKREQNDLAVRLNALLGRREQQARLADPRLLQTYTQLAQKKKRQRRRRSTRQHLPGLPPLPPRPPGQRRPRRQTHLLRQLRPHSESSLI